MKHRYSKIFFTFLFLYRLLQLLEASRNSDIDFDDGDDRYHVVIRKPRDYEIGGPVARETKEPKDHESGGEGKTTKAATTAVGSPRPPSATPPPGAKGTGKSSCAVTVVPSSVLPEVATNSAQLPDYNLKYMDECKTIGECARLCDKAACNYFIRSQETGKALFYTVSASKLNGATFVESSKLDSFLPQCPAEEKAPDFAGQPQGPAGGSTGRPTTGGGGTGKTGRPPGGTGGQPPGGTGGPPTPGTGEGSGTPQPYNRKPSVPIDRCPECTLKDKFKRFLLMHNLSYSQYEEERRFKIFQDALNRIQQLNAERELPPEANFTVTKFTVDTFGEFLQMLTGAIPEDTPADKFQEDVGVVPGVPIKFDWTDEGVIPEPRDQKSCGSCYAFATTDLAASQWSIDHGERKAYLNSPQIVLDCVKGPAAFGCNGGRPYLLLATHANCTTCPWPRETCYPYEDKAGECRAATKSCIDSDQPRINVKHAHYLDVSQQGEQGEKERLSALLQGGTVVALVVVTDHFQYYSGGVMRGKQCKNSTAQPNHAVLITGYDFSGEIPAYIIKNSWGRDWGEDGYFRLEAGVNACGVGQFLSFACTSDCGDRKSQKQLVDRAIKRQNERGIGLTTTAATTVATQGYGVPSYFPPPAPTTVASYIPPPPSIPPYGAPTPGYGAPTPTPGYGAPAPTPGYGTPAPTPGYGAPAPTPGYGAPAPTPGYGAPAPPPTYSASPTPNYYPPPAPTPPYYPPPPPTPPYYPAPTPGYYPAPTPPYNAPAATPPPSQPVAAPPASQQAQAAPAAQPAPSLQLEKGITVRSGPQPPTAQPQPPSVSSPTPHVGPQSPAAQPQPPSVTPTPSGNQAAVQPSPWSNLAAPQPQPSNGPSPSWVSQGSQLPKPQPPSAAPQPPTATPPTAIVAVFPIKSQQQPKPASFFPPPSSNQQQSPSQVFPQFQPIPVPSPQLQNPASPRIDSRQLPPAPPALPQSQPPIFPNRETLGASSLGSGRYNSGTFVVNRL